MERSADERLGGRLVLLVLVFGAAFFVDAPSLIALAAWWGRSATAVGGA